MYSNPRLPGVTTPEEAVDYIVAALYPNYIGTFATPAALPGAATANDFAVVTDDGDGKSAGYVWVSIDGVSQWMKRYDVDWSMDDLLQEAVARTFPMYVHRDGFDQLDASGIAVAGIYAGQKFYGGASTGTNLTFNANAADATGYVQTDNTFRPTANGTLDLGTAALRWSSGYINTVLAGTMTISGGSITDTSGAISFADENLTTTGQINAGTLDITTSGEISTLSFSTGSITDSTGAISFSNENLSTTGTLASGTITVSSDLIIALGSITSASGAITFANENLSTTGTLGAGNTTVTRLDSDNVRIDGNTISILDVNGNLILSANGTGVVDVQSAMTTLGQVITGTVTITGQLNADNLRLDGNVISSQDLNGNITFTPNGSGVVVASSHLRPSASGSLDLGGSTALWSKLWLSGSIGNATTEITLADLLTLRSTPYRDFARTIPAQSGDSLFWDAVNSVWLASVPDTEITHGSLTGLTSGDAGHSQFVMLSGRAGGQVVQGGTAASETLVLESTAHATKGSVLTKDDFKAFTNASYSGSWSGTDIGGSSNAFRDVFTKGEFRGFRLENFTVATLPAASASSVGRIVYATDNNKLYADTGSTLIAVGVSKFMSDTAWNGSDTSKTVTVSGSLSDARTAIWQLCDNTNDYDRIYCSIKAISATQVTITVTPALPAGAYRLLGIE